MAFITKHWVNMYLFSPGPNTIIYGNNYKLPYNYQVIALTRIPEINGYFVTIIVSRLTQFQKAISSLYMILNAKVI